MLYKTLKGWHFSTTYMYRYNTQKHLLLKTIYILYKPRGTGEKRHNNSVITKINKTYIYIGTLISRSIKYFPKTHKLYKHWTKAQIINAINQKKKKFIFTQSFGSLLLWALGELILCESIDENFLMVYFWWSFCVLIWICRYIKNK